MLINIRRFIRLISLTIFPRRCIGCQIKDFWICEKCLDKIPMSCERKISFAFSIFEYRNHIIRKAIWMLKFNKRYSVLQDLEEKINIGFNNFLKAQNLEGKNIILIPIPITKRSRVTRGYNQSELICKIITKNRKNLTFENKILLKSKNHLAQNKIKNKVERINNVRNSFEVKNEEKIKREIVVLIDDVTTTGATLDQARKSLNKAGVKKVFAFTWAH